MTDTIFNCSVVYDVNNREPLLYEEYPGSITDVTQLQCMLQKMKSFGYEHAGFILDRGYFSKENIHYMDNNGYDFIMMVKGMKSTVSGFVKSVEGTFEKDYSNRIYTTMCDEMERTDHERNYMTVPAAIRELEKIEMIRYGNDVYRLDHSITKSRRQF